jgi:hypothetical protein
MGYGLVNTWTNKNHCPQLVERNTSVVAHHTQMPPKKNNTKGKDPPHVIDTVTAASTGGAGRQNSRKKGVEREYL